MSSHGGEPQGGSDILAVTLHTLSTIISSSKLFPKDSHWKHINNIRAQFFARILSQRQVLTKRYISIEAPKRMWIGSGFQRTTIQVHVTVLSPQIIVLWTLELPPIKVTFATCYRDVVEKAAPVQYTVVDFITVLKLHCWADGCWSEHNKETCWKCFLQIPFTWQIIQFIPAALELHHFIGKVSAVK